MALPDTWSAHWPHHDGVVWYRFTWNQADASQPLGLMVEYWSLAGEAWLNGSLIARDPSLTEPLTRSWDTPHYWLLSAPLLRAGTNTLLVRVSGLADYQPGLGPVTLGAPAAVRAAYGRERLLRRDLHLSALVETASLGAFFLALWLLRRQEAAYGWFTLMSGVWLLYTSNQYATSPWPFRSTDLYERVSTVLMLAFSVCYAMFLLRFAERRLPRVEKGFAAGLAVAAAAMFAVPRGAVVPVRSLIELAGSAIFLSACVLFVKFAWRSPRFDCRILSYFVGVFVVPLVHDMLSVLGILHDNVYYASICAQLLTVCMALVLAWHFTANLRRIERFNDELGATVTAAREELARTLQHQHALEVANARLGERLNLAHDLHDGFGGTLVSAIATLEHSPDALPPGRFLGVLRELRDDLRIIIDAASREQPERTSLGDLLGPLRHRMMRLFENHEVECRWNTAGADGCRLAGTQAVDVMRLLQEALTNVLRHSGASRVDIDLGIDGAFLHLSVRDNGRGFDHGAQGARQGTGLQSMRARTVRLGGTLTVTSGSGGTQVSVRFPAMDGIVQEQRVDVTA
ncbi:sensor histidine kinase [Burkholderia sp. WAC0059]|uniref:sensor histidine kinase n=1 Tax=Burkholderia sp. WAC0059 TaxID=2066022 RepID=UPI0015E0910B|nr:ATP-binding protein [Burkholderia sp. WAC0059]